MSNAEETLTINRQKIWINSLASLSIRRNKKIYIYIYRPNKRWVGFVTKENKISKKFLSPNNDNLEIEKINNQRNKTTSMLKTDETLGRKNISHHQ